MRSLICVLMFAPSLAMAAPVSVSEAVRIESEWLQARSSKNREAIVRALESAARLPWPMLEAETEREIAASFASLSPETRRQWAIDRALPMLSGELQTSDELLREVLKEVGAALSKREAKSSPDLARLQEARRDYAARRLKSAEAKYAAVTKSSPLWPDALRERAWTLLLLGRPHDALGSTVSLNAPYFPPEDHAEARLMKAAVLLRRCRFAEAREVVSALADAAVPTLGSTDVTSAILSSTPPSDGALLGAWSSPLVERVRTSLVASAGPESPPVAKRREDLVQLGTRLFTSAFEAEAEAIRDLKERALKVRYEAFRGERGVIEQGQELTAPVAEPPAPLDSDDDIAWEFDGTFWRDELGTYRYSAGDACPKVLGR